jgi:hypothetical protein
VTTFDWLIQDGRRPPPGPLNPSLANVAYGIFDASWRRTDRWSEIRDSKEAAKWTLRRPPAKDFAPSPATLQAAAGRYELFQDVIVNFRPEGTTLVGEFPAQATVRLVPESDFIFAFPETSDTIEFVRDANGNVSGASVDLQGSVLWAKRLP